VESNTKLVRYFNSFMLLLMDYKCKSSYIWRVLVYLHSFSCCWLPNLRNPAKFRENSNL